ncbi:MAG: hypothetical protein PUI42_07540 [Lachnospiraceae bacterium]|nr:hypothetical protein [Lachnospiraceae bacterium]
MLQFIMDRNLLLYVLAAACVVGVASQMILKQIYDKLIRDTKNTGEPDGRFLQQLRQRFQYCTHLNEKVGDVHALIQKSMMEYRFWGMGLHRWKRLGVDCLAISLLCAFAGTMFAVQNGGSFFAGNIYFVMGALCAVLTALAYGISDTGYRRECLEVRLTDYLENSGAVRDYSQQEEEAELPGTTPIVPVEAGRKAKRRARAENTAVLQTRAQKDKDALKENLARVKAGVQETAAEREREKNLEFLRQMDPKEQERILKEVLKEVLS